MVSLNSGPISSLNFLFDSDTLLSFSSFCTFNPSYPGKTCIRFALPSRKSCGPVLGFLEVKPRKKSCCSRCSGVLRMCNKRNLGWDCEGSKDLETEILDFMKNSEKPGMFPSKKDLIRSGRFDLVERILNQGGWLSLGWDLDEKDEEEEGIPKDLRFEKQFLNCNSQEIVRTFSHGAPDISSDHSSLREEVVGGNESGIEGILTRLEKERNFNLGISLREIGESNGAMNNISPNGSVPWSSRIVSASEIREVGRSRSSDDYAKVRYQEAKPVSETQGLSKSPTSETWRTWSMRRAGFTDEDFEAAEISSSGSDGEIEDDTNKDSDDSMNRKDRTAPISEDNNNTHIKSRLQHFQSELSSVLHSLRSPPDEVVTSKDSEITSGNLENLSDDWEFKENEIIHAKNKLRSTRAKLAVLEGKMAMAITYTLLIAYVRNGSRKLRLLSLTLVNFFFSSRDAQRIIREKQRRIDHASRALRLLRTACIVWPNSASEVLLTGSFDGWSTQRKMKKANNGVFSLSLKLYPGKYEIKFIVDGQWKVDPLRPIVTSDGYENNLLIIS